MPHSKIVEDAVLRSNGAAGSALIASWSRSMRLYGLDPRSRRLHDPMSDHELSMCRERLGNLLDVAKPSLERLHGALGGAGCCILLADEFGIPVHRRGNPADEADFRKLGLWPGTNWSEQQQGTNGIGTALAERRALTIHHDQHFSTCNIGLSCTVGPIFDHNGSLRAVLSVSSARCDLTEDFTRLIAIAVAEATRRIESELFRQAFPNARILLAHSAGGWSEKGSATLLAVDEDDLVVGATRGARQMLSITDQALSRPLPASIVLGQGRSTDEDYATAERRVIQRALAQTDGNVTAAAAMMGISRATLHRKLKVLQI